VLEHRVRLFRGLVSIQFGIEVRAAFLQWLLLFIWNAVSIGPSVPANASHLPRCLGVRFAPGDFEAVAGDLARDVQAWLWRTYGGQLVAEIPVECFKVIGQRHPGFATRVEPHQAVVDVHHVG